MQRAEHESPRRARVGGADIAFCIVFLLAALLYFFTAGYSVKGADECFYLSIPYRLLLGDHLVADEWHLAQFSSVFQYLPLRLFCAVTGGTAGSVLFFRYLYVGVKMIFFAYIYASLRPYRYWALLCAFCFTGYNAGGLITINYYNSAILASLLVCMLLFVKKRATAFDAVFAGFVFACAVLAEPVTAYIYFIFSVLTLIRALCARKNRAFLAAYDFLLNGKTWGLLTAGIALCALAFCVVLLRGTDLRTLLANIPSLLGDGGYVGADRVIKTYKLQEYVGSIGTAAFILQAVYCVAAVALRRRLKQYRLAFFAAACAALLFTTVSEFVHFDMFISLVRPVALCLFGLVCYALSAQKDRRLFVFLLFSMLLSFGIDNASKFSIGIGCAVSIIPAILLFRNLSGELRADVAAVAERRAQESKKEKKRAVRAKQLAQGRARERLRRGCAAATLAAIALGAAVDYSINTVPGLDFRDEITVGPQKGIKTKAETKARYEATLRDVAFIREQTDGPLYVDGLWPGAYLYAGLPYGTYSAWYDAGESFGRSLSYWESHPDARPAYIYVPLYICDEHALEDETAPEKLGLIQDVCACEITQGEAGYIIRVDAWKSA